MCIRNRMQVEDEPPINEIGFSADSCGGNSNMRPGTSSIVWTTGEISSVDIKVSSRVRTSYYRRRLLLYLRLCILIQHLRRYRFISQLYYRFPVWSWTHHISTLCFMNMSANCRKISLPFSLSFVWLFYLDDKHFWGKESTYVNIHYLTRRGPDCNVNN